MVKFYATTDPEVSEREKKNQTHSRKLRSELWGGIILIVIGTKILIEHLFF